MSDATTLLWELEIQGALVTLDGDGLNVDSPQGLLTPARIETLAKAKADIITILKQRGGAPGYKPPQVDDREREAIQWADSLHPNQAAQIVAKAVQGWRELVNPDCPKPAYACPYCGATDFWRWRNGRITCSGCLPAPPKGACQVVLAECEDGSTEWKAINYPESYFEDFQEVVGADGRLGYDAPDIPEGVAWWRTSAFEDLPSAALIPQEAASKVPKLNSILLAPAVAKAKAKQPSKGLFDSDSAKSFYLLPHEERQADAMSDMLPSKAEEDSPF